MLGCLIAGFVELVCVAAAVPCAAEATVAAVSMVAQMEAAKETKEQTIGD
jgi:hypothetical protein